MKYFNYFILISLFATAFISCEKKGAAEPECGCGTATTGTITDRDAVYVGDGQFVILPIGGTGSYNFGWACDVDTSWQALEELDKANYTISGNWKRRCIPPGDYHLMRAGELIEITKISAK